MGIGFAIPSNMAKSVVESLIEHGKVVRGWLGVAIQEVTQDLANEFGATETMGALVGDVMDDSPASKAGLKRGNIITEFDHKPVKDPAHLQLLVAELAPGTQVSVTVFRDKQTKSLSVTLGELPKDITDRGVTGETTGNHALAGVTVESLSGEELHRRQIESGVVVRRIDPRSPARQAGLQEGDIIREIKRKPLKTIIDFEEITRNLGPTDGVLLLITRRQATIFLMISPQ